MITRAEIWRDNHKKKIGVMLWIDGEPQPPIWHDCAHEIMHDFLLSMTEALTKKGT